MIKFKGHGAFWIRTCQECGYEQSDSPPNPNKPQFNTWTYRKCRNCKSEALDYGSTREYKDGIEIEYNEEGYTLMPLNKRAIFDVLNKAPLCHGTLIKQAGLTIEYCAMGALAKSVGVTDEYLQNTDSSGRKIWDDFGYKLHEKFGIESLQQFQTLMHANDGEKFSTRRNKAVISTVEALSPEEIDAIIQETCEDAPSSSEGSYHYGSDD